ncbi:hypothetical protein [Nocardiopsis sp. NPDC006832]|uniref:hypothetical protein n=1 Tax=Nocardiopsis sp. NPDC006832 TaxID=3157188 RepID=UPI003410361D
MSRVGRLLVARLRRDDSAGVSFAADLDTAEACARAAVSGAPVRLLLTRPVGTIDEWAAAMLRQRPRAVALFADARTHEAAAQTAARLAGSGVSVTTGTVDASAGHVVRGSGEGADELFAHGTAPASPYRHGVVPVRLAETVGVRVRAEASGLRPIEEVVADLDHIAGRATAPMSVPLIGGQGADLGGGDLARALTSGLRRFARRGVTVEPRLSATAFDGPSARDLAGVGFRNITLTFSPGAGAVQKVRGALSSCAAYGLLPRIVILVPEGEEPRAAPGVAELLRAVPDADVATDLVGLRRLAGAGALAGVSPWSSAVVRLRRRRREDAAGVRRSHTGRYHRAPVTAAPHHLWWEHRRPPSEHRAWIGSAVASGGSVVVPGGSTETTAAHVPVVAAPSAVVAYAKAERPLRAGHLLHIGSPADADDLLTDAELAWREGALGVRLFQPEVQISGLCRVGAGPCAGAAGLRLFVDPDGLVRTGSGGPVVGTVGDDPARLRAAVRAIAPQEDQGRDDGCRCRPAGWPARRDPVPPWLDRVLGAAAAVTALSGEFPELARGGMGGLRISGCGGPITHTADSAHRWSNGAVLLRHRATFYLYAGDTGRCHRVSPSLALLTEVRWDLGEAAREHLVRQHGLGRADADEALRRSGQALHGLVGPDMPDAMRRAT